MSLPGPWKGPPTVILLPKPGSRPVDPPQSVQPSSNAVNLKRKRGHSGFPAATSDTEARAREKSKSTNGERIERGMASNYPSTFIEVPFPGPATKKVRVSSWMKSVLAAIHAKTTFLKHGGSGNVGKWRGKHEEKTWSAKPLKFEQSTSPIDVQLKYMTVNEFRGLFVWKVEQLPVYNGPFKPLSENQRVLFPLGSGNFMHQLFERGHVESLRNRLYEMLPLWKNRKQKIYYFPSRQMYINEQHAVVLGPATQELPELDAKFFSPFEKMYGQEWPLFYAFGPHKNRHIYYMGTYRCVKLNHYFPAGFFYQGGTTVEKQIARCAVDSQSGTNRLDVNTVMNLLKEKRFKIEFAVFQLVDFKMDVYNLLTTPRQYSS
ncbi:hypothetical protein V5O48_010465 [Marasmius crinis-equi]|uniref:Uncharacterized protein n=1 Tax=Marasmius crinis-equi TaxID=585013 RepID=A0ABR3F8A5_9AGAR